MYFKLVFQLSIPIPLQNFRCNGLVLLIYIFKSYVYMVLLLILKCRILHILFWSIPSSHSNHLCHLHLPASFPPFPSCSFLFLYQNMRIFMNVSKASAKFNQRTFRLLFALAQRSLIVTTFPSRSFPINTSLIEIQHVHMWLHCDWKHLILRKPWNADQLPWIFSWYLSCPLFENAWKQCRPLDQVCTWSIWSVIRKLTKCKMRCNAVINRGFGEFPR